MNPYPFLKDNIEYLQRTGNPIFQWLSTRPFNEDKLKTRLFVNHGGLLDWKMDNDQGLLASLPPQGLYGNWIHPDKAESSATFVVGCNLGYGINHVLSNTPDTHKVMLLEPRSEMLLACLGQTDYRPFFECKKFHLLVPDERFLSEVIRNLDLQFIYGQIHLKRDIPSSQLGPEYAQWSTWLKNKLENFSLELSTLRHRQDVMVKNEIDNFAKAMRDGSLKSVAGKAAGVGAVILGAGPSLETMAPLLKEKMGHVLYTCALQTIPSLQTLGIKPHLCAAIDYDKSMLKVFERLDPDFVQDVPLIYSTKIDPMILKRYPGPTLPMWTVGGVGTYVLKERDLVLDAGGNVSVTLSRFLRYCGVSHLLLAGQDYAWINGKSHSGGHHNLTTSQKRHPWHQTTRNMDGEEILTTVQYMTAKRELEADLKQSEFPVFNLYGGGVPIEGTKVVDVDTAYGKGILASAPGAVEGFLRDLAACRRNVPPLRMEPRSPMWTTSMHNLEKHLGKLFRNIKANQQDVHAALSRMEQFVKQDPLYSPYLFNEIIDLAGLTRAKFAYEAKDLGEFKRIAKNVLKKVREIDRKVCLSQDEQAVA
ncbi:6-hydroxymethylpterin diphosphokinase MptE-like protein [Desulfovibrio sp. Huiquan2017]|uniref:motility associated factor glycosyltransferase family protein n=1 Tax=Desulfovibrio sp. Huiquan2017 TaxID=2816861 RepID=UPI001A92E11A|nr:6-hydroxymethylpterin diphosphokinase MptE-like protein [Desulfovibrio sp. Huiquan2017]